MTIKKKTILLDRSFTELSEYRFNYYERQVLFILLSQLNDYDPLKTMSVDGSFIVPTYDIIRNVVNPNNISRAKLTSYIRSAVKKIKTSIFKTKDRNNSNRDSIQLFNEIVYNRDYLTITPNMDYVKVHGEEVKDIPYVKYDLAPILLIQNKYSFKLYKFLEDKKNFSTIFISMQDFLETVFFDKKETKNINAKTVEMMLNPIIDELKSFVRNIKIDFRTDLRGSAFKAQTINISYTPLDRDVIVKLNKIISSFTLQSQERTTIEFKQTTEEQEERLNDFILKNFGVTVDEAQKISEEIAEKELYYKEILEVEDLIAHNPEMKELETDDLNETILINTPSLNKKNEELLFDSNIEDIKHQLSTMSEQEKREIQNEALNKMSICNDINQLTNIERVLHEEYLLLVEDIFE